MNTVYRFRIYPNKSQRELFAKTFGCVRFVYNRMLAEKKAYYEKTGKNLSVTPARYKSEFPWLKEVDSLALCNAQLHLQIAYKSISQDNVTKEYMKDNRRFADVFNSFVYEGEQVIKPENLQEQDTTELLNFYGISDKLISRQEFRDVLKKCVLMRDEKAHYLLFGIENQSNIHYAMPVKNCIYDALNYGAQADEAANS